MTVMPLAEVRSQLSKMVDAAVRTHQRVEITRNGVRAAVLLGAEDYDSLIETLEILADAEVVRELALAEAEHRRGEVATLDEVGDELRNRGIIS